MFFYILQYFLKIFFKLVTEFQSVSIISCTPIFLISHVIDFKNHLSCYGVNKKMKRYLSLNMILYMTISFSLNTVHELFKYLKKFTKY